MYVPAVYSLREELIYHNSYRENYGSVVLMYTLYLLLISIHVLVLSCGWTLPLNVINM